MHVIDLDRETLIPLAAASNHYPGCRPHRATVFRHAFRGVGGIKLETIRVGGRRMTSLEAIRRFAIASVNPMSKSREETSPALQPSHVEQALDAAGF